jgi:hypothetical protein
MPSGTLQVYTALAENAAPLPGVTVLVLNEAGIQIARLSGRSLPRIWDI